VVSATSTTIKTVFLNPLSAAPSTIENEALLLGDLSGKSIGFLSNNKPNAGVLLERAASALAERFSISARHYNKGVPSLGAPPELIERIVRECGAVVLAVND